MKKVLLSSLLAAGACAMFNACSDDSSSLLTPSAAASSSSVAWEEQSSSSVGLNSSSSNLASSSADGPLSSATSSSNVLVGSQLLNLMVRLRLNTPRTLALRQSVVGIRVTGTLASRTALGLRKARTIKPVQIRLLTRRTLLIMPQRVTATFTMWKCLPLP